MKVDGGWIFSTSPAPRFRLGEQKSRSSKMAPNIPNNLVFSLFVHQLVPPCWYLLEEGKLVVDQMRVRSDLMGELTRRAILHWVQNNGHRWP